LGWLARNTREGFLLAGRMHVLYGQVALVIIAGVLLVYDATALLDKLAAIIVLAVGVGSAVDLWVHFYRH